MNHFTPRTHLNPSFFTKFFVSLLVLVALLGVFFHFQSLVMNKSTKQCDIEGVQTCSLSYQKEAIELTFLQMVELEEELKLEISLPVSLQLTHAWVQGVNMYMGKTAVVINASLNSGLHNIYQASIFLGACSEPKMKWQLVLQGKDAVGQKQTFFFNFSTER